MYEQYVDDFVNNLNGQFAIALWDKIKQRLLLMRDWVGILPLFYSLDNQRLIFGSEIKSLLCGINHKPAMNITGLDQLFTFWAPVSTVNSF